MQRNPAADIVKGLAVLFMVQVHLMELFALPAISAHPAGRFSLFLGGPPAAPVFMAVMGFFLAQSKKSRGQLFLRGIKLFFGGLLLNIALNAHLLFHIYIGESAANPFRYIFGVDILFSAGLSVVVIAAARNFLNRNILYPFAAAFIVALIPSLIPSSAPSTSVFAYVEAYVYGTQEWSYFPLLPWLAYPLMGYSFSLMTSLWNFETILPSRVRAGIVIVWILFLAFTGSYGINTAANLPVYYHHGIKYFLWCTVFLSGYVSAVSLLAGIASRSEVLSYAAWLGKNVTAAYVLQWVIIGNIASGVFRSQNGFQLGLWFLGIMAAVSGGIAAWNLLLRRFTNSGTVRQ